jgi:thioredoxin-like negative regulator of GroEL
MNGLLKNLSLFLLALSFTACQSAPGPASAPGSAPQSSVPAMVSSQGLNDELRALVEIGTPSSLSTAISHIAEQKLGNSEFGRTLNALTVLIFQTVYPGYAVQLPLSDPPQINAYAGILRNIADKRFEAPSNEAINSSDYLAIVLPSLVLINPGPEINTETYQAALPGLELARAMRLRSVLAPYLLGIAYEGSGLNDDAEEAYRYAWTLSYECYPAALALASLMHKTGREAEALALVQEVKAHYAGVAAADRLLAEIYYSEGNWSAAEPMIAAVLNQNPQNAAFLLMQARTRLELGAKNQAKESLNRYAQIASPGGRDYRFLQAQLLEGDEARTTIRSLQKEYPNDSEIAAYAAGLLLASNQAADQAEGRTLLSTLMQNSAVNNTLLVTALQDAVQRQSWNEARSYLQQIPSGEQTTQTLLLACQVWSALGDYQAELSAARSLYQKNASNDECIIAYAKALIDTGGYIEAGRLINNRLEALPSGQARSRYYYLRSRLQVRDELMLADLQSSRYDDSRNLDALIALIEYYQSRENDARAILYLKQAEAVSPGNARLKPYEEAYKGQY